jgi:hypothetical protein
MSRIEQDRREDAAYQAFVDDVVSRGTPGKMAETGLVFLDLADDPRDERVPQVVCYVRQAVVAELLAAREGAADDAARDLRRLDGALGRLSTAQAHGFLADTVWGQAPDSAAVRARLDPNVCSLDTGRQI